MIKQNNIIYLSLLLVVMLASSIAVASSNANANAGQIKIYLPTEMTVSKTAVTIGLISIVSGDEKTREKIEQIPLGTIMSPSQVMTLDRKMILARLACNKINTAKVVFSGADKVVIRAENNIVPGALIAKKAIDYYTQVLPLGLTCKVSTAANIKDLHVPSKMSTVKLIPSQTIAGSDAQPRVTIDVICDGAIYKSVTVTLKKQYKCQRLVAIADIRRGQTFTSQNTVVKTAYLNSPQMASVDLRNGSVARRKIAAGTVITPQLASIVMAEVVIKRNQSVIIRIERPGLLITAAGQAIQKGRVGDLIKVRNVDSKRIILAKINSDLTVSPIL